jgi:hypothetical protein
MVKEMRSCPGCARSINEQQFPFGLAFCPYCGDMLPPLEPSDVLRYCPYCGLEQASPGEFCPHCSKKIMFSRGTIRQTQKPEPTPPPKFKDMPWPVEEPPVCETGTEEETDFSSYRTGYEAKPGVLTNLRGGLETGWVKLTGFVGEYVNGRYRVKRLYRNWTRHSALPEDEVPSGEALAQITRESGNEANRPLSLPLVMLVVAGLVLVFVGIGVAIRSC